MKIQPSNILDLEQAALERLGDVAGFRRDIYQRRIWLEPEQVAKVERRYNHLFGIVSEFEAYEEAGKGAVA